MSLDEVEENCNLTNAIVCHLIVVLGKKLENVGLRELLFMTSTSFKHALSKLLLPPVIAQAILACVLALLVYSLESSATWVDHTDQVIARMNKLTRLMIDEETGVRGYLLTGRKEFLEPYDRAQPQIDPAFQQLQQLVNDPFQTERLQITPPGKHLQQRV